MSTLVRPTMTGYRRRLLRHRPTLRHLAPTSSGSIFVLSMLLPGPQILIYLLAWFLIPDERR